MRIYRLQTLGSIDGLVAGEAQILVPGAGEVLVKVRATSLNFRDYAIINGWFPVPVPSGRVPLSDGAGEIEAIGVGVSRFKVGDRVVNSFFPNWFGGAFNVMPEQYVIEHDGWLTEYKVLGAEALVSLPEYLSLEAGATPPLEGGAAGCAPSGRPPGGPA